MSGWRWRLRTWSPDYDGTRRDQRPGPESRVDPTVERPLAEWRPLRPAPGGDADGRSPRVLRPAAGSGSGSGSGSGPIVFVDGVQRIDAWADLDGPDGETGEALFASFAAGGVRVAAGGEARVAGERLGRLVIGGPPGTAADVIVGAECYRHQAAGEGAALDVALQVARDRLEVEVAEAASADVAAEGGLVVVDGPLHHRDHVVGAIGFVKSHRVEYLSEPLLRRVVVGLQPGERTPLFLIDSGWGRWSWYWRLPVATPGAASSSAEAPSSPAEAASSPAAPEPQPNGRTPEPPGVAATRPSGESPPAVDLGWAGLVRGEASGRLSPVEAARLADAATRAVTRFASSPIKDPRAPQNLVPVGGLERHLRHRLGDRDLLERALRLALSRPR